MHSSCCYFFYVGHVILSASFCAFGWKFGEGQGSGMDAKPRPRVQACSRNPKRWDTDPTLLCPCCCPVFNTITLSIHQLRVKTWTNQPTMNTEHTNHFTTCCSTIMLCMVFSPWTYILSFDFSLKRTCLIPVRKEAWWLVLKCFATTAVAAKTLFPLKGGRKFSTITSAENTLLCHGLGHYNKVWTRNWF